MKNENGPDCRGGKEDLIIGTSQIELLGRRTNIWYIGKYPALYSDLYERRHCGTNHLDCYTLINNKTSDFERFAYQEMSPSGKL